MATSEGGISSREPADLSDAAAADLRATGPEAERKRVQIEALLHPAPVLGDPSLIERLAANLIDNAVRHNTTGGTVQLTTGQHDGRAVLGGQHRPGDPASGDQPAVPALRTHSHPPPATGTARARARPVHRRRHRRCHSAEVTAHARPEGGLRIQVSFPIRQQPAAGDLTPSSIQDPNPVA
jgi:signal transduction histidine kinase